MSDWWGSVTELGILSALAATGGGGPTNDVDGAVLPRVPTGREEEIPNVGQHGYSFLYYILCKLCERKENLRDLVTGPSGFEVR